MPLPARATDPPKKALASAFITRREPLVTPFSAGPDESGEVTHAEVPYWPAPMGDAAYAGLAGEFVRAVFPASESDSAALIISFLVGVGSLVGRHVHYQVERD